MEAKRLESVTKVVVITREAENVAVEEVVEMGVMASAVVLVAQYACGLGKSAMGMSPFLRLACPTVWYLVLSRRLLTRELSGRIPLKKTMGAALHCPCGSFGSLDAHY